MCKPCPASVLWCVCQQGNGGAAVATPGADAVLDIIMARIGISQYFVRLDALTAGPQFATAAAGDAGMRLVTRDETAAAMAADDGAQHCGFDNRHTFKPQDTACAKCTTPALSDLQMLKPCYWDCSGLCLPE